MKRLSICLVLLAISVAATAQPQGEKKCAVPPFLEKGDAIALISPSYHSDMESVEGAAQVLREWGYNPIIGANVDSLSHGKYAGTTRERLSDLHWALTDPEIKAIICNRGGYGTLHLVDMIDAEEFAGNPKWLVGFSDITTILAMENCAGVMGIHGTVGGYIAKYHGQDSSSIMLRELLEGKIPEYKFPSHPLNIRGKGTGKLVGGNICTLVPLLGTSADPTRDGDIILFLEEVEESYHNIDRLLNTLLLQGVFNRCKGVILGYFTDCGADLEWDSAEAMICSYLQGRGIPVMCGFPAGHEQPNLPLIMGAEVNLEVKNGYASLSFNL